MPELRVVIVLLDFLWFAAGRLQGGAQLGGRRHLVREAALRDGLLSGAAAPLAARYGRKGLALAWSWLATHDATDPAACRAALGRRTA